MILQSLYEYYLRKSADPDSGIAPPGFEVKEIPFLIVLDKDGRPVNIEDTREGEGKKKRARRFLVPQSIKRTVIIAANLLWDNAEYVLGVSIKTKNLERLKNMHLSFLSRIEDAYGEIQDEGLEAVRNFYKINQLKDLVDLNPWKEIAEVNPNISFRYIDDVELICQRKNIVFANKKSELPLSERGRCLISGNEEPIERLHSSIKGIYGAQSSGANIVSFNLDAFRSFHKEQGENAPIGKNAAFAYTTGLNHLLRKDSRQKILVGDTTTVFWTEKPNALEMQIPDSFGESPKDDPDRQYKAVRSLYRSIETGALGQDDRSTRFYVLGISPNASRLAVRFWHVSTVAELAIRIKAHFDDLQIIHRTEGKNPDPEFLSLFRLLVNIAVQGKAENIIPNLCGDIMRSILDGTPYPKTLLSAAVRRIRSSKDVSYPQAAIIKACLNRQVRYSQSDEKEVAIVLDESNVNIGYRLGRMFAVLEKTQEEANPSLNATIRDRYYGAASSTPITVFPILLRLKVHHLAKLENRGRAVNLEKLFGVIMDGINDFPTHLEMGDQGRFAIGYYHQRQDFYKKTQKEG
jgi:CRISPR-associated protein Csd1